MIRSSVIDFCYVKPLPEMQNMKIDAGSATSSKEVQRLAAGVKIPCKTLTTTEEFKCSISELYRALTDREVLQKIPSIEYF